MFYLTTHSTHFIYGYMASVMIMILIIAVVRKEGRKCLFNDALNTFHLRLYGVSDDNDDDVDYSPVIVRKARNVLFNDALNTFYLRLYGVRHMVKDHSDS